MLKLREITNQQGSVSIFSVIFFIIIISVILVSFLKVVNIEQQQATDNSSSDSALAAARSGIEDGKRVLLLAAKLPASDTALKPQLESVIGNPSCSAIMDSPEVRTALGINEDGKVYSENGTDGQFITCLTIERNTDSYENIARPGASVIFPLRSAGAYSSLRFSWHRTATDGALGSPFGFTGNPTVGELMTAKTPSYMRVQLISVPKTNITPSSIAGQTVFLGTSVLTSSPGSATFERDDDLTGLKSRPTPIVCGTGYEYACSAKLSSAAAIDTTNYDYYLRVTALYTQASFQVELLDSSDAVQPFDAVQPIIDSTGKTGSTFRRLRARVSFTTQTSIPEYVVEATGLGGASGTICKDVRSNATTVTNGCGW